MPLFNRYVFLLLLLLGCVLISPIMLSFLFSNIDYVQQNRDTGFTQTSPFLELANEFYPMNMSARRGKARVYISQGSIEQSIPWWRDSNVTAQDMVIYAENANRENDLETAVNWLLLAEQFESNNLELWFMVGAVCQKELQIDPICDRFLNQNDQNLLLNTDFAFQQEGWQVKRTDGFEADYYVVDCPEKDGLCGYIGAETAVPEHGLSWSQCLTVSPNQLYTFSAWIKVEVVDEGSWRPIYFQGKQNGQNHGVGRPNQQGASAWKYWENSFFMPELEDDRACFYPVRLLFPGQIWFYDAKLVSQPE